MFQLAKALSIVASAFNRTLDKGDYPYFIHCYEVMRKVKHLGETAMICAILHDLIEDCPEWSFDRLREDGFSQEVITILELLTHRKDTDYMDYIKAISVHSIATAIKKADLEHNMKVSRLKGLRKKDFDRLQKYAIAYEYLK